MVLPVSQGADPLLITTVAEFESQFWYMETVDTFIVQVMESYHFTFKEFEGRITEADKQPTTVLSIVDEDTWGEKLSAYAFGMSCCICGANVGSRDRQILARKGEVRTLCSDHLSKVLDLRKSIKEAHRKVDKTVKSEIKEHVRALGYVYRGEKRRLLFPPPPPKPKRVRYTGPPRSGYVYRLLDTYENLLYVGKTWNIDARFYSATGHAATKPWWIDVRFARIEEYSTEASALEAEAHIIKKERPRYNVTQPVVPPKRKPPVVSRELRVLENGEPNRK